MNMTVDYVRLKRALSSYRITFIFIITAIIVVFPTTARPCRCFGNELDCSYEGVFESPDFCGDNIEIVNLSHLSLQKVPENLGDKFSIIDLSFNKLRNIPTPQEIGANVRVLELRSNNIRAFNGIEDQSNLKELNMYGNPLRNLKSLPSPCNLIYLNVGKTRISSLKGIDACKDLQVLDISDTNIYEEKLTEVSKLENLQYLYMKSLEMGKFPVDILKSLKKLIVVDMSQSSVPELKKEDCSQIPQLEGLILTDMFRLKSLPAGIFPDLNYLELSRNRDLELQEGFFSEMSKLVKLSLDGVSNAKDHMKDISKLPNLIKLDLSFVDIKEFPYESFSSKENLIWLGLQNTGLKLQTDMFNDFSNLTYLDISGNDISFNGGEETLFQSLKKLEDLILIGNNIGTLPGGLFDNLVSLRSLDLRKSGISELPSGLFSQNKLLRSLSLSENPLKLSSDAFQGLTTLEELYLSKLALSEIPSNFSQMEQLKVLMLDENEISSINPGAFQHLKSLEILNIGSNTISEIPEGAFLGLKSLKKLVLSNLKLTEFSMSILADCPNLEIFWLNGNPLKNLPVFDAAACPALSKAMIFASESLVVSEEAMRSWLTSRSEGNLFLDFGASFMFKLKSPKSFRWALDDPDIEARASSGSCGSLKTANAYTTFCFQESGNWIETAEQE